MFNDPLGAVRHVLLRIEKTPSDKLRDVFEGTFGGSVRDANGTYTARYGRISASSTAGREQAIRAWARKAREQVKAADAERRK